MWWIFIQSLVVYLQATLPDVSIKPGREEGWPIDYPAIRVLRGGETGRDIVARGKGFVTIWIDCWCQNNDIDPNVAYEMLNELETRMLDVLKRWMYSAPGQLKLRMQYDELTINTDGDHFRPRIGSRTVLKIFWNK